MVAFNSIKAGDQLWDVHRQKMGNTTMSRLVSLQVVVEEIDAEAQKIFARWNGNPPKWMYRRQIEKLRRSPAAKT